MKAWHVQDSDGEHQEVVFADKRNEAIYISEAYGWADYINVRAKRAKYADGLENESKDKILQVLLENGWWFECGNCYTQVTEEDKFSIQNGHVFCEKCTSHFEKLKQ
jgi:hypothetical protein